VLQTKHLLASFRNFPFGADSSGKAATMLRIYRSTIYM
jgi:hypothetical protein